MSLATPADCPSANAESRERILAAAKDLFAESGFDAVSMNAIAERACVSKANVFHHFKSKNDLYLTVLSQACDQSRPHIDQLGNGAGSLDERLRDYSRAHLESILQDEKISRLFLRDVLEKGPQRGEEFADMFSRNFSRLVDILRSGQKKGELRKNIDPAMVAALLIGADVFFFQSREILRHFPDVKFTDQPARYSEMLVDILLHGIRQTP